MLPQLSALDGLIVIAVVIVLAVLAMFVGLRLARPTPATGFVTTRRPRPRQWRGG